MATQTVDTLVTRVLGIAQEPSYSAADVIELLYEGLVYSASRIYFPDLEQVGTVSTSTSTNIVALPSDYLKGLHRCTYGNTQIKVYDNQRMLDRVLSAFNASGNVVGVAPRGRYLYYQNIPATSVDLVLHYIKMPDILEAGGNCPDYLPSGLAAPLLKHYALWKIFEAIEDGVEGEKVNTKYHEDEYEKALANLFLHFGPEPREQRGFGDELGFGALIE